MKKHYFELDKIESITLNYETETSWRWMDAIPARPKTFLGIKYGMHPEIPAGWNEYIKGDGTDQYPWNRRQSSYLEDYKWLKVTPFRIWNKARVEIRLGYKQSFGVNFDSNEEAQAYVDELIASSDKKFHVIINK
jgi:hypothetical protein